MSEPRSGQKKGMNLSSPRIWNFYCFLKPISFPHPAYLYKHLLSSVFSHVRSYLHGFIPYTFFKVFFKAIQTRFRKNNPLSHGLKLSENIKLGNVQTPGFSDLKLSVGSFLSCLNTQFYLNPIMIH